MRPQLRESWYSHQYGVKQSNRQLYAQWKGEVGGDGVCFYWQFRLHSRDSSEKEG